MKISPAKPPSIALTDALDIVAPLKPGTAKPSKSSLPGFHANVFARLLAAKPKMDTTTRRVYPSSLLTKIGIQPDTRQIGAMSAMSSFYGPRIWVSASPQITKLPKEARGRLASKHPAIASLKPEADYGAKRVLLEDLKLSLELYLRFTSKEEGPIVCFTRPNPDGLVLDISDCSELAELGVPATIRSGKYGIYLSGNILRYLYIYGPRSS